MTTGSTVPNSDLQAIRFRGKFEFYIFKMLIRTMLITLGITLIKDISSLYLVLMKWKAQVKY